MPSVILTSQFTTPKAKSFSNYLQYMTRKDALLKEGKHLTNSERNELDKIGKVIRTFDIERGGTFSSLNNEKLSEKEYEANRILKSPDFFSDSDNDYEKYIRYMGRQYALETKKGLSAEEEIELSVVRKKISSFVDKEQSSDEMDSPHIQQGVFSINKEFMTVDDLDDVNEIVKNAQKSGSVFYQDVVSFDTDFLVKEGIYDPDNNMLDEKKIQAASRKMMDKMFEDENINAGYWFATIHRNTDHIHIHYGTVETKNTREIITVKEDGGEYYAPKGKRKQSTIDNMKSTFANTLIDRTAELSRISELRNTLVQDVKESYGQSKDDMDDYHMKMVNEIYDELPNNKKNWNYGSKYVSEKTRNKIDIVTDSLMEDNEYFNEFISKTESEGHYRKELFGESTRTDKDYAKNKKADIQKRLGNTLLKEMKKDALYTENIRNLYKEKRIKPYANTAYQQKQFNKPIISKKNIHQIKRSLHNDYEKYRAEKEHEYIEQKIAMETERRSL